MRESFFSCFNFGEESFYKSLGPANRYVVDLFHMWLLIQVESIRSSTSSIHDECLFID